MTAIEILATIFAVAVLVKLVVATINLGLWMKLSARLLARPVGMTIAYLALTAVVGYYVLQTLRIVDVAAVMLLTSSLIGVGFAPYGRVALGWQAEVERLGLGRAWPAMLLWAALSVWVLYAVLLQ